MKASHAAEPAFLPVNNIEEKQDRSAKTKHLNYNSGRKHFPFS